MLSVFRWFIGCWHEWGPWEDMTTDYLDYARQHRYCKKCGKRTWRFV